MRGKGADGYLKNGKAYVWDGTFAIIKSQRIYPGAFANILDRREITVVIGEGEYRREDALRAEKGWRIITFDMELPFEVVGFVAKITRALADAGVGVFVISAYSTDHVLVKDKDLEKAVLELEGLGIRFPGRGKKGNIAVSGSSSTAT